MWQVLIILLSKIFNERCEFCVNQDKYFMLKNFLRNTLNNSLLYFRNRIGLLTPFAKINKGEGLNKRTPRLSRSFTGGKRKKFCL